MSHHHSMDHEDICLWADDSWCFRYELEEFGQGKSDDYEVIPFGTTRHEELSS